MTDANGNSIPDSEKELALAVLEPEQLAVLLKKKHIPRRRLRGIPVLLVWSLRIYLLFMLAVVGYQIWAGAH